MNFVRRVRVFLQALGAMRDLWLRSPIDKHNLKAMWVQSDPDWMSKFEPIELTDEEWEEYLNLLANH